MWTLSYNGVTHSFAEYGISDVVYSWKNQMPDKVTFSVAGRSITDDLLFAPGEIITIYRSGVKWFEGVITQTPLYGTNSVENQQYEASGGWWYLENLIYQQQWNEPIDPSNPDSDLQNVLKSRIILGQDINGDKISIGEQITDVINYARVCGANIALEAIEIDVIIPFDECKDLSCAEVIRRLLRWVPDTICYVDYSKPVPTFSFKRRAQLPVYTMKIFNDRVKNFSLQPRYDLCVPAVVLKFETTNSTNSKAWKTLTVQKYPQDASGMDYKTLVLTINLEGIKANYVAQKISTSAIDTGSLTWWKKHVPWLQNFSPNSVTIRDISRTSILPDELEDGVIADWMDKTVEEDTISAKFSYKNDDIAVIDREVVVKLKATDATTGTYKKLLSVLSAETVPDGLAKSIFESVGTLQYDGSITLIDREVEPNILRFVLNFSDGREEWKTMNAVVQEIVQHLDTGETYIKFGPAKHLGAADLAELTRSGRVLIESRNYSDRVSAEASGNGLIDQGVYCKLENTSTGEGKYGMLKFVDPNNSESTVKIDASDLTYPLTVIFREEDVCDSGVLKKRFSLASEPFIKS